MILLLAIACLNVTNLLLARSAERRAELAMRAALGAPRQRLVRQLLTESLLLASLGGTLGVGLAFAAVRALAAISPPDLPRADAIGLDRSALVFAFAVTTLVGVAVGALPALQASGAGVRAGLEQASRRLASGRQLTRRSLVVVEVALALVLLAGAGLLLRSLQRLLAVAPGFDSTHLITMQVQTSGPRFDDPDAARRFFAQALEAVRQAPGVTAAGFTSQLPLTGDYDVYGVHFESSPTERADEDHGAFRYAVSPGYLEAMAIPLRRGRRLDARDRASAPLAVVINESFAKRRFPGQDPIGQRLHVGPDSGPWFTIVGVVGDVRQVSLSVTQTDAAYMTTEQWRFADRAMWLVARGSGDVATLAPALRSAISRVDKDQPIVRVAAMDERVAASVVERRFALVVFQAFAALALVLACVGIYGVLSGSVAERTREIGVRLALGAPRHTILAMILRQGLALTGLGVALGLAGAMAGSAALVTLLYGVSRADPVAYAGVIALLGSVAAVACWLPAWRAARVDPSITLRSD